MKINPNRPATLKTHSPTKFDPFSHLNETQRKDRLKTLKSFLGKETYPNSSEAYSKHQHLAKMDCNGQTFVRLPSAVVSALSVCGKLNVEKLNPDERLLAQTLFEAFGSPYQSANPNGASQIVPV